jgi:hypothetical protein
MHADDLARLRAAIADGKPYRDQVVPDSEIPRWKAMSLLQQRRWDLNEAAWKVRAAREAAKTEGRDFRPEFNGADHEDPMAALRKLLDIGEEEWFHLEDAGNISIKTTPEGKTTIRISKYGQWLEVDEDMNTKSSFDDE